MMANMSVKCINKKICEDCEFLDIEIQKRLLFAGDKCTGVINNLNCKHYEMCSKLLIFLNENKDYVKYIGRDGD